MTDDAPSNATVAPPPEMSPYDWPEPGANGEWGEFAVVHLGGWPQPSLITWPAHSRRNPLRAELDEWRAAGLEALQGIDDYIDALGSDEEG